MKKLLLLITTLFFTTFILAQQKDAYYNDEWKPSDDSGKEQFRITTDPSIDIKFYHLDVSVAIDSSFIRGNVYIRLQPTEDNLNKVTLNLHPSMKVDSVTLDGISFDRTGNELEINLNRSYAKKEPVELKIFYHGKPVLAGGYKGLVYTTHGANEPLIVTLSTPFLAHYWYPCKDGPQDKADSMYMDITIKDTTVNGINLIAVSNGILEGIDRSVTAARTFKWRHRYPIVPYYVMLAVSNYEIIRQQYHGVTSSFPLIYYVFKENYAASLTGVSQLPQVFDIFSKLYGDYPFSREKYGITELGFYGGIENQTNTIQNNLSAAAFYTSVHELAHEWFADMITCSDWHHGWLNEGFASYSEALVNEHLYGKASYHNYMTNFEYYGGGTVYLPSDTDAFKIFETIIYDKGAYVLHMLRGVLGDSVFFKCLYDYAKDSTFRYSNATTEDFVNICKKVSGQNLQTFFQQWIYDAYYPIYKYNFSSSSKNSVNLYLRQDQGPLYGWRPIFEMPLPIRFQFLSGKDTTVTVVNDNLFQYYSFEFSDSVTGVQIDPNKWVLRKVSYDPSISVTSNRIRYHNDMTVFPNPADQEIQLVFNTEATAAWQVEIDNVLGEKVFEKSIENINHKGSMSFDISSLQKGIYFITVTDAKEKRIGKFIKR